MKTFNNVVVVQQARDPVSFGIIPLLILCGIVALVINYFWQLLAIGFIIYLAVVVYTKYRAADTLHRRLIAEADLQNNQFYAGDPRGTFGDLHEGPQLR